MAFPAMNGLKKAPESKIDNCTRFVKNGVGEDGQRAPAKTVPGHAGMTGERIIPIKTIRKTKANYEKPLHESGKRSEKLNLLVAGRHDFIQHA